MADTSLYLCRFLFSVSHFISNRIVNDDDECDNNAFGCAFVCLCGLCCTPYSIIIKNGYRFLQVKLEYFYLEFASSIARKRANGKHDKANKQNMSVVCAVDKLFACNWRKSYEFDNIANDVDLHSQANVSIC